MRRLKKPAGLPLMAFLAVLQTILCQFAEAQLSLTGKVTNRNSQSLPAVVICIRQGSTLIGTTLSDSTGNYRFQNITKGDYHLLISHRSYKDSILPVHRQ